MSYELKCQTMMAVILFALIMLGCFTVCYSLWGVDSPGKENQEMFVKDSSYTYKSYIYLSLEPIMKELVRRLDSIPDRIGFCFSCIMESDHYIEIGLTDATARNIQDFRNNVMDSPVFRFVKSSPINFEEEQIGVSPTFCTKVSLSIIFQKEAIIFICLNSQKRWFKRSLQFYFDYSYKYPNFIP